MEISAVFNFNSGTLLKRCVQARIERYNVRKLTSFFLKPTETANLRHSPPRTNSEVFGGVPMIERRALERIEINQPAMLHIDGISGVYGCVVRDVTDYGAKVHCPFYIFSPELDLSVDGFKTRMRCQVVWRRGTACGVRFVH